MAILCIAKAMCIFGFLTAAVESHRTRSISSWKNEKKPAFVPPGSGRRQLSSRHQHGFRNSELVAQRHAQERLQASRTAVHSQMSGSVAPAPALPETDVRVAIIGSGNFGSTVAKLVAENVQRMPDVFNTNIEMYVFEETIQEDGKDVKLSEVINRKHENVKYLPGIKLPENINANPDLEASVKDADVLVFLAPHQFVIRQVMAIKDVIKPNAVPVSLIKGGFDVEDGVPKLLTEQIRLALGGARGETSVLMGANLANELAAGKFAESTLGSRGVNSEKIQKVFNHPTFKVNVVPDIEAVEICGALKNVVALAAGFSDGLDMGNNAKAAIIRNGLMEIRAFVQHFYPDTQDGTFFESAGVADLVTTCYGGRNRKCAEAFARSYAEGKPRTWDDISKELLNGQQLQGTLTAEEVIPIIKANNLEKLMPIHVATYAIAFENAAPDTLYAAMASV